MDNDIGPRLSHLVAGAAGITIAFYLAAAAVQYGTCTAVKMNLGEDAEEYGFSCSDIIR